jgi:hypothetical protein
MPRDPVLETICTFIVADRLEEAFAPRGEEAWTPRVVLKALTFSLRRGFFGRPAHVGGWIAAARKIPPGVSIG